MSPEQQIFYRTDRLYITGYYNQNKRRLVYSVLPIILDNDDNEYIMCPLKEYHNYMHHCYNNISPKGVYAILHKEIANWDIVTYYNNECSFINSNREYKYRAYKGNIDTTTVLQNTSTLTKDMPSQYITIYTYKDKDIFRYERNMYSRYDLLECDSTNNGSKTSYYIHMNDNPKYINTWGTGKYLRLYNCIKPVDDINYIK